MKLTQKDLAAAALDTDNHFNHLQLGQYGQGQRGPTPDGRWCSGWRKSTSDMGGGMPGATDVQSASQAQTGTSRRPPHHPPGPQTSIRGNDQRVGGSASKENWINLCDRFFR